MSHDAHSSAPDRGHFLKRAQRYTHVSGLLTRLISHMAGQRFLGWGPSPDVHAQQLKDSLGHLHGPVLKVAQILATVPDLLPPAYAEALRELQSNAPPMGRVFVKRRMISELGPQWHDHFDTFDMTPKAAASLGQVHYARLASDSTPVACKLQYPDMASVVAADLNQLKVLMALYEKMDQALVLKNMYQEIHDRLYEELDYGREARHMRLFAHIFRDDPETMVPRPVSDLSTQRLLTMTWMGGRPLLAFKDAPKAQRCAIARIMFHTWYRPLYHYGVLHGDPHLGNYLIHAEAGDTHVSAKLLDFGCVRLFKPSFVQAVLVLYEALRTNRMDLAVDAYKAWGFQNLTKEVIEILNLWARYLYGPLIEDRIQPIQKDHKSDHGRQVAAQVFEALRRVGGVAPPQEFVLMDRAAVALGSLFMHLRAELNWHALFSQMIDGFDVDHLQARQKEACRNAGFLET